MDWGGPSEISVLVGQSAAYAAYTPSSLAAAQGPRHGWRGADGAAEQREESAQVHRSAHERSRTTAVRLLATNFAHATSSFLYILM